MYYLMIGVHILSRTHLVPREDSTRKTNWWRAASELSYMDINYPGLLTHGYASPNYPTSEH